MSEGIGLVQLRTVGANVITQFGFKKEIKHMNIKQTEGGDLILDVHQSLTP